MSTSLQQANTTSGEEESHEGTSLPSTPIKSHNNLKMEDTNPDTNKVSDSSSLDTPPHRTKKEPIYPRDFQTDSDSESNISCGMYLRSQRPKLPSSPVKCSRTGEAFQVTSLPEAGSYKKEKRDRSTMPQKMWDPARAKRMGLDDFVQLYCPKNKKEIAMTLLHRRNYKITGFLEALQEIPPTDGSEWTEEERENFLSLLQQNKYNFNKVAKAMNKTVSNCLTVYYKIINVRKTRNRRKRVKESDSEQKQPPKELNEGKIELDTNQTSDAPSETRSNERKRRAESDVSTETEISSSSDEKRLETKPSQDDKENKKILTVRRSKRFKSAPDEEKDAVTKNIADKKESATIIKPEREAANNDQSQESQQEISESSEEELPEKEHVRRSARLGGTSTSSSVSTITGLRKRSPKIEARKLPTRKELPTRKASAAEKEVSTNINLTEQSHLDTPNTTAQDEQWEKTLKSLIKFKEEHGHCLVPKIYPENQNLSYWVFRQRGFYWKRQKNIPTSLTVERIKKLTDIGFMFRVKNTKAQGEIESLRRQPKLDEKWEDYFKQLTKYKEKNGNCLVPKVYKDNRPLASWVFNQRHQFRLFSAGEKSLLNQERIDRLEKIGFIWNAKKSKEWKEAERNRKQASVESIWQGHYKNLVAYKKKHGTTRVPKKYSANQALSTWVFRQRAQYRLKINGQESNLTDSRLKLLKDIDFTFRVNDW